MLEREHKERENSKGTTTSIVGARRPNHSWIIPPGMHKYISGRDNVQSTDRNDVRIADKLDTTVDGLMTDERNTASSGIIECTPKSIFRKDIKEFDSSIKMNLANYVPVKTPDLVSFRDLTVNTDNVTDPRSGGVATRIADKDGIWKPKPSNIGTAATHGETHQAGHDQADRSSRGSSYCSSQTL